MVYVQIPDEDGALESVALYAECDIEDVPCEGHWIYDNSDDEDEDNGKGWVYDDGASENFLLLALEKVAEAVASERGIEAPFRVPQIF